MKKDNKKLYVMKRMSEKVFEESLKVSFISGVIAVLSAMIIDIKNK